MSAPQVIWIVFASISLAVHVEKHGQPKRNYHIMDWVFGVAVEASLLYWGGFFK